MKLERCSPLSKSRKEFHVAQLRRPKPQEPSLTPLFLSHPVSNPSANQVDSTFPRLDTFLHSCLFYQPGPSHHLLSPEVAAVIPASALVPNVLSPTHQSGCWLLKCQADNLTSLPQYPSLATSVLKPKSLQLLTTASAHVISPHVTSPHVSPL